MGSTAPPMGQPKPFQDGEFTSQSRNSRVSWSLDKLPPPSDLYITRDDQIVVQALSSVANEVLTINARLLTIDGVVIPVQSTITPLSVFNPISAVVSGVEGFLLSLSVVASQALMRGQSFARVWLNRGARSVGNDYQLLIADYCTQFQPATWPFGPLENPVEGPGEVISIHVGNPGAGTDWLVGPSVNMRAKILSASAVLTTSATAGNRNVQALIVDVGSNTLFRSSATGSIPATTVAQVTFAPGSWPVGAIATDVMVPLPPCCVLANGFSLSILTAGLLAGDQWSAIYVQQERWFEQA